MFFFSKKQLTQTFFLLNLLRGKSHSTYNQTHIIQQMRNNTRRGCILVV